MNPFPQREVKLISSDAGRIIQITPGLCLLLDPPKKPPVVLTLTESCSSCGATLASWTIPVGESTTMIACDCTTAVVTGPNPEKIVEHWKGAVMIRSQSERLTVPPMNN